MDVRKGYKDLRVYRDNYVASIKVIKERIPPFPKEKRFDSVNQLTCSAKAVPRLIAKGYAKKRQRKLFQIYVVDAMG